MALVSHQFFLQLFYTFFQLFYFVGLRLYGFVLGLSAAQSGCRHAFLYSAFFYEGLLQLLKIGGHHLVHLPAEGEGKVCQFLVRCLVVHIAIVLLIVVLAAIFQHVGKAWMMVAPFAELASGEVVFVIFFQFLDAASYNI